MSRDEISNSRHNKLPDFEDEMIDYNHSSHNFENNNSFSPCKHQRPGNETLSLQEFKEKLGSFEEIFEDTIGSNLVSSSQEVEH